VNPRRVRRTAAFLGTAVGTAALLAAAALAGGAAGAGAMRVTIIESQSLMAAHDMDVAWMETAGRLGYAAHVVGQDALDGGFVAGTDVLVVASGEIDLPAARADRILAFLRRGGRVYLQGEYLKRFTTNVAFARLARALGATFAWTDETSGDLKPMDVVGPIASLRRPAAPLEYFWYGVAGEGSGSGFLPFLRHEGRWYGFAYCAPPPAGGVLVTTTDKDWIQRRTSAALMDNILFGLAERRLCQAS
jgi:hypothetical protein